MALTVLPLALPAALAYRLPAPTLAGPGDPPLAVRRARRLPPAGRHVPVPLVPGAGDPARHPRRAGRRLGVAASASGARRAGARVHDAARLRPQARGGEEQRPPRRGPVLHLPRRGARDRGARARPAAGRSARADLLGLLHPVHDGPRDLRGRAVLVTGLRGPPRPRRRAVRGPSHRRAGARLRAVDARALPVLRLPQAARPQRRARRLCSSRCGASAAPPSTC